MKVGIDVRNLDICNRTDKVVGGIDQATLEIARALKKMENEYQKPGEVQDLSVCLIVNDLQEGWFEKNFSEFDRVTIRRFALVRMNRMEAMKHRGSGRYKGMPYMRYLYKCTIKRKRIDVTWLPVATPFTYIGGQADVFTIHDIIAARDNEVSKRRWQKMILKLPSIISVSEFTKNEIIELGGKCVEDKIIGIIPNAITVDTTDQKEVFCTDKKYILSVNAYLERKNQKTLIKAFAMSEVALAENMDLIFVGGYEDKGWLNELKEYSEALGLSHRVHFFLGISDAERNYLLTHAELFVNASTFEGFGRTPVEAAICKIPVITTKVSSLYEATMGLLHYVEDPYDADELCKKMDQILKNRPDEETLERISKKLSQEYDAMACAGKYLAIFQKITEARSHRQR